MTGSAQQSIAAARRKLDCFVAFAPRNDVNIHFRDPAARYARVLHVSSAQEGRGECRAPNAPAASRAKVKQAHEHRHHRDTGNTRHSRTQWFYGLFRALPGDRACLPPSPAKVAFHELDASVGAPGPHDFAVRIERPSSKAPSASTASRPASVTIASRPSVGRDGKSSRDDLPDG